jgi:hypothetical protein
LFFVDIQETLTYCLPTFGENECANRLFKEQIMADPASSSQNSTPPPERSRVAEIVALFSLLGITALSGIVLVRDKASTTLVFTSVLPLLGSWMGTVLAFYFSRDNLAAATQSVRDLSQAVTGLEKLKTIQVKDKMRPLKDIKYEQVEPADEGKKNLSDLMQKGVERIPILNAQSVVRYLIYKNMIDKYLAQFAGKADTVGGKKVSELTLTDLLSDAAMKKFFESSFAFVPLTATLADAKREMEAIDKCGDVFVTNTGKKDEPILGWITDNAIIENSRV